MLNTLNFFFEKESDNMYLCPLFFISKNRKEYFQQNLSSHHSVMTKRKYEKLTCERIILDPGCAVLAQSVNKNSVVSSVGQEIDVDVTFTDESFVNTTWETE